MNTPRHLAVIKKLTAAFEQRRPVTVLIAQGALESSHVMSAFLADLSDQAIVVRLKYPYSDVLTAFREINRALGFPSKEHDLKDQLNILTMFLETQVIHRRCIVLCVEQADKQSPWLLEAIAKLVNLEASRSDSLMVVLSGGEDLNHLLRDPSLDALRVNAGQRIELARLSFPETKEFVRKLVELSGLGDVSRVFAFDAIDCLQRISGGCPDKLGRLCHEGLLLIKKGQNGPITTQLVEKVASQLGLETFRDDALVQIEDDSALVMSGTSESGDFVEPETLVDDSDLNEFPSTASFHAKPILTDAPAANDASQVEAVRPGDARLVIWRNGKPTQELKVCSERIVIGRETNADVCLPSPLISRRHAMIIKSAGSLKVVDLGSTHGTFLRGKRITECALEPADVLTLGEFEVQFVDPLAYAGLMIPLTTD